MSLQKFKNYKTLKKKKKILYWSILLEIDQYARYRPVFKPVRNVNVSIPVYVPVRYIPTGAGTVSTTLISSINIDYIDSNFIGLQSPQILCH